MHRRRHRRDEEDALFSLTHSGGTRTAGPRGAQERDAAAAKWDLQSPPFGPSVPPSINPGSIAMNEPESSSSGSGIAGSLKLIAGLCILILATLAALLVLKVIPQDMFQEWLTKTGLLALIAALATIALGALTKMGRR